MGVIQNGRDGLRGREVNTTRETVIKQDDVDGAKEGGGDYTSLEIE